ncbi:hypothetical protein CP975_17220 [Streptomyces alboniger]|uniref:Uncharacterized protein n=1 Tax=Streptomyces alboniger TaxID=132473 RepID=A0A5J6HKQ5_STRAD|nr:hypothetical protein CP975_17220 [Streptomyces alboniger]
MTLFGILLLGAKLRQGHYSHMSGPVFALDYRKLLDLRYEQFRHQVHASYPQTAWVLNKDDVPFLFAG